MNQGELTDVMTSINNIKGVQKEIIELIGMDAYVKLCKRFGGHVVYIGEYDKIQNDQRNKEIISKFDGGNYYRLADEYGLSERSVRYIIDEYARKLKERQLSFFDIP